MIYNLIITLLLISFSVGEHDKHGKDVQHGHGNGNGNGKHGKHHVKGLKLKHFIKKVGHRFQKAEKNVKQRVKNVKKRVKNAKKFCEKNPEAVACKAVKKIKTQFCKKHPKACETIKNVKKAKTNFCKKHPKACETADKIKKAKQNFCKMHPERCEKLKQARVNFCKKHPEFEKCGATGDVEKSVPKRDLEERDDVNKEKIIKRATQLDYAQGQELPGKGKKEPEEKKDDSPPLPSSYKAEIEKVACSLSFSTCKLGVHLPKHLCYLIADLGVDRKTLQQKIQAWIEEGFEKHYIRVYMSDWEFCDDCNYDSDGTCENCGGPWLQLDLDEGKHVSAAVGKEVCNIHKTLPDEDEDEKKNPKVDYATNGYPIKGYTTAKWKIGAILMVGAFIGFVGGVLLMKKVPDEHKYDDIETV